MSRATRFPVFNMGLVLVIALGLSSAWLLDGPSEHQANRAQADSLQDAIRAAQRQARFAKAAKDICGDNVATVYVGSGVVQCKTRGGFKTMIAKVAP